MSELTYSLELLWPILFVVLSISLIFFVIEFLFVCFIQRNTLSTALASSLLILLAFATLGATIGYVSGLSRTPAITTVVPAILSLIGTVAVFVVGKDRTTNVLVGKMVLALSLSFLFGLSIGSTRREVFNSDYQEKRLGALLDPVFQKNIAEREGYIRRFRTDMDLPPEPVDIYDPSLLPRDE